MILNHLSINKDSPESVIFMLSKYQVDTKVAKIYKMYCNGDYGFDHYASKSGQFQLALIKLTRNLLRNQSAVL